eukprot:4620197-Prymnesium_polylepis.1
MERATTIVSDTIQLLRGHASCRLPPISSDKKKCDCKSHTARVWRCVVRSQRQLAVRGAGRSPAGHTGPDGMGGGHGYAPGRRSSGRGVDAAAPGAAGDDVDAPERGREGRGASASGGTGRGKPRPPSGRARTTTAEGAGRPRQGVLLLG